MICFIIVNFVFKGDVLLQKVDASSENESCHGNSNKHLQSNNTPKNTVPFDISMEQQTGINVIGAQVKSLSNLSNRNLMVTNMKKANRVQNKIMNYSVSNSSKVTIQSKSQAKAALVAPCLISSAHTNPHRNFSGKFY